MRVGIIGAGQLARMLALAAHPLNIKCHCMGISKEDPAVPVSDVTIVAGNDEKVIEEFAHSVDVITFENENVDRALASVLSGSSPLRPGIDALEMSQDRLVEKRGFEILNIPVAPFVEINSLDDLKVAATQDIGFPCILKTRRFGYDGKGQYVIKSEDDLEKAFSVLGEHPLILEGFVNFDCEVSIVAVRRQNGDTAFYPLTKNEHRDGILRVSTAPFVQDDLQAKAEACAETLMSSLEYVGVLAIELFVNDGELIVNEFAPRVHNSGHWTIEGAQTSQFENHIRAVCDLPLGSTALVQPSMMINFIGHMPLREEVLAYPGAHFHDYQKSAREGRKLGHVTVCSDSGFDAYKKLIDA